MLKLVQKDIAERENLIHFVFRERLATGGGGSSQGRDASMGIREEDESLDKSVMKSSQNFER